MRHDCASLMPQVLRALGRFDEALAHDPDNDRIVLDATIRRFEVAFELVWRLLQAVLLREGIATASPRAAFRGAYAQGWLEKEAVWIGMIEDRIRTSHTYEEEVAKDVLSRLPAHLAAMRAALAKLPAD